MLSNVICIDALRANCGPDNARLRLAPFSQDQAGLPCPGQSCAPGHARAFPPTQTAEPGWAELDPSPHCVRRHMPCRGQSGVGPVSVPRDGSDVFWPCISFIEKERREYSFDGSFMPSVFSLGGDGVVTRVLPSCRGCQGRAADDVRSTARWPDPFVLCQFQSFQSGRHLVSWPRLATFASPQRPRG